jgi:hypothetical protein
LVSSADPTLIRLPGRAQPRVRFRDVAGLPPDVFQRWLHSHEEDSGGVQVYRPAGYRFPPARGRRGFELRPDGSYIAYGPGPADKPTSTPGRWEPAGDDRVRIGGQELEIVSVEPDRLTARWAPTDFR